MTAGIDGPGRAPGVQLVCPETKLPLHEQKLEHTITLAPRRNGSPPPVGTTSSLLVRSDGTCAYPVQRGVPILLAPEMLLPPDRPRAFDLSEDKYAEAYEEMDHYNAAAEEQVRDVGRSELARLVGAAEHAASSHGARAFPRPRHLWIDAKYDSASQWDAYNHLAPLSGKRVLQIGGTGVHALKLLFAGASEAWLVSPMLGELNYAQQMASHFGVADRFACVAGLAEELPFADESFDVAYAGGCAHHFVTSLAFPECARVLRPLGRFAAVEPWRAPLYRIGTRIFGKREPNVHCRPLNGPRIQPLVESFAEVSVVHHGALTRYAMLALASLGVSVSMSAAWKVTRVDDAICSLVRPLRRYGSSVAVLAAK